MQPKRRYLTGNKGTEIPSSVMFIATSADRIQVEGSANKRRDILRDWTAISGRMEGGQLTRRIDASGNTADGFWSHVMRRLDRRRPLWIFGEDVGRHLTLLNFWGELDNGRISLNNKVSRANHTRCNKSASIHGRLAIDGIPVYIICYIDGAKLAIVDTLNYWREGLHSSSTGELDPGIQQNNKAHTRMDSRLNSASAARSVSESVINLLVAWQRENCGVFQLTGPSLALTNYRHTCGNRVSGTDAIDIVCQPGQPQNKLEREAYHGGRITTYRVGRISGPIWHVDCNSLYPYIMRNYALPRRFARFQQGMSVEELRSTVKVYGAVAEVVINSPYETFPIRIDNKVYYVNGVFRTVLCGGELRHALDTDSVRSVGLVQVYSVANLFREWVDYWFNRKVDALRKGPTGAADLEFAKLMLNSLYGKWAQHGRHWKDRPDMIPPKRWGGWAEVNHDTNEHSVWRAIAGNSQVMVEGNEPVHSFPAISAFITSYAREYMRWVKDRCGIGEVYYLGVDGMLINGEAYRALHSVHLTHPYTLGSFKVCGVYPDCEVFGPNDYRIGEKRVCSGHIGNALNRKDTDGTVQLIERLPSIVSNGPRADIIITHARPFRDRPDYRGTIDSEGWWHPYRLSMEPEFSDRPVSPADLLAYC